MMVVDLKNNFQWKEKTKKKIVIIYSKREFFSNLAQTEYNICVHMFSELICLYQLLRKNVDDEDGFYFIHFWSDEFVWLK